MIIQAVEQFNLEDLQVDLLTIGCYVFHDAALENICEDVIWQHQSGAWYQGHNTQAPEILQTRICDLTKDFFAMDLISSKVWRGIDQYTDQWHDDAREKMDIQFLCYQATLGVEDGGALEMRCFDGQTRQYFPRMGDVAVINHKNLLTHRVSALSSDRVRIVCNAAYRYRNV